MWTDEGNLTMPYSYVKHINFINFEEFGLTNPIYINFVRHPIGMFTYTFIYIAYGCMPLYAVSHFI